MTKKTLLSTALGIILVLYPALVYFGLQHYGPRIIAGFLLALTLLRFFLFPNKLSANKSATNNLLWITAAALLATLGTLVSGSSISLKLYPVLVNTILLIVFSLSLYKPPTIIEKIARLQEPDLPEEGVNYTRKVTQVWCIFFLINGGIAMATVFSSDQVWALYNGFISYIAIGCLFSVEYVVRRLHRLKIAEHKEENSEEASQ